MSAPTKRKHNDENQSPLTFKFVNAFGPPPYKSPKKQRRIKHKVITPEIRAAAVASYQAAEKKRAEEAVEAARLEAARSEAKKMEDERLRRVLAHLEKEGFANSWDFIQKLLTTNDPKLSAEVTPMVEKYGAELIRIMETRKPGLWRECSQLHKGKWLGKEFRVVREKVPDDTESIARV